MPAALTSVVSAAELLQRGGDDAVGRVGGGDVGHAGRAAAPPARSNRGHDRRAPPRRVRPRAPTPRPAEPQRRRPADAARCARHNHLLSHACTLVASTPPAGFVARSVAVLSVTTSTARQCADPQQVFLRERPKNYRGRPGLRRPGDGKCFAPTIAVLPCPAARQRPTSSRAREIARAAGVASADARGAVASGAITTWTASSRTRARPCARCCCCEGCRPAPRCERQLFGPLAAGRSGVGVPLDGFRAAARVGVRLVLLIDARLSRDRTQASKPADKPARLVFLVKPGPGGGGGGGGCGSRHRRDRRC